MRKHIFYLKYFSTYIDFRKRSRIKMHCDRKTKDLKSIIQKISI